LYHNVEQRLSRLLGTGEGDLFAGGGVGLEKESLRVSPEGVIAQTAHPAALGSALTNAYITTDYSEALMEFITPPLAGGMEALSFLRDAQKFVYDELENEILWATSMPCVLQGGENIPIAEYGSSNAGIMKTVYRRGLGHRYGRVMQVIAGVHFNYSLPDRFWKLFQHVEEEQGDLQSFIDTCYFGLVRNLQRYGWLVPYLFGASPAVCKSFLNGKPTTLEAFDDFTYYEPFATSLRMGDIGYTNKKEEGVGVKACYCSLDSYVASLTRAIETPCPAWEQIGVVVNGRYEQLNANILQIENEYYSTVRPKQMAEWMEKPTLALQRRGVRYVELRSLDVNAYHPLGISEEQLRFLEAFLIFCVLQDSPGIDQQEQQEIDHNLELAAHRGRDPSLQLLRKGERVLLSSWAEEICRGMQGICEQLDKSNPERGYSIALAEQLEVVQDPDATPSARMLAEMRSNGESFFQFAKRKSLQHHRYFDLLSLEEERRQLLQDEVALSRKQQRILEQGDSQSFAEFLQDYFDQQ
jgi:glutamate--cysteine ligase